MWSSTHARVPGSLLDLVNDGDAGQLQGGSEARGRTYRVP